MSVGSSDFEAFRSELGRLGQTQGKWFKERGIDGAALWEWNHQQLEDFETTTNVGLMLMFVFQMGWTLGARSGLSDKPSS